MGRHAEADGVARQLSRRLRVAHRPRAAPRDLRRCADERRWRRRRGRPAQRQTGRALDAEAVLRRAADACGFQQSGRGCRRGPEDSGGGEIPAGHPARSRAAGAGGRIRAAAGVGRWRSGAGRQRLRHAGRPTGDWFRCRPPGTGALQHRTDGRRRLLLESRRRLQGTARAIPSLTNGHRALQDRRRRSRGRSAHAGRGVAGDGVAGSSGDGRKDDVLFREDFRPGAGRRQHRRSLRRRVVRPGCTSARWRARETQRCCA